MPMTATELCRQAEIAFGRRGSLMSFWQETADNFYPERADFTQTKTIGESFASNLYDSNPIIFRRDFGDWLSGAIRPKGRPWFNFRARNDKVNKLQKVKTFLTDRADVTRNLFYDDRSQFISSMKIGDHDWATFGNAVASVEDRSDRQGLLFKDWHLRDCAWEDNGDGVTHKMFRKYKMSAENLGLKAKANPNWKLPERVQRYITERKGDTMVECMHIVMPADLYDMPVKKRRGLDWVSLHVSVQEGQKGIMSERPVPVFNYSVSRWFKLSVSPYAFSPAVCCALPDARTIQAMTWAIIEAGEKAVEPPLAAVREAILGGVEWYSGGITWLDGKYDESKGEAIRAIQMGKEPQLGAVIREAIKQTLGDAWYINKLFMPPPANQPMTAEEANLRFQEFLRVSQPIIEPAETERNGKMIEIAVEMAQYLGYWGEPEEIPDELMDEGNFAITYDNPVEDARKLAKTQAFSQSIQLAGQAQAIDPALPANVDWQTAFREAVQGVAPPSWLLTEEDAAKSVQEAQKRAAVERAGQQIGQVMQTAEVAASANQKQAQADAVQQAA